MHELQPFAPSEFKILHKLKFHLSYKLKTAKLFCLVEEVDEKCFRMRFSSIKSSTDRINSTGVMKKNAIRILVSDWILFGHREKVHPTLKTIANLEQTVNSKSQQYNPVKVQRTRVKRANKFISQ